MKRTAGLLVLLFCKGLSAQNILTDNSDYFTNNSSVYYLNHSSSVSSDPACFLNGLLPNDHSVGNRKWICYDSLATPGSLHYFFRLTFNRIPVFGTEAGLHCDAQGKPHTLIQNLQHFLPSDTTAADQYLAVNGRLEPVFVSHTKRSGQRYLVLKDRQNRQLLNFGIKRFHHTPPDSLAEVDVFLPDPLSSANVDYGNAYSDFNDSATPFLNGQLKKVQVRTKFRNDTFFPGNPLLQFREISNPVKPLPWSLSPSFLFKRNQPGFEDFNVLYHLSLSQEHIRKLGMAALLDTLIIDTHAFGGADQSAFDPQVNPGTLEFGEGGTDDAEDADVAIHEFMHALSHKAAPGTNTGSDRRALEEGICDYWAMSHSLRLTGNQSDRVYNWDGHNEFWPGRGLLPNAVYPDDLVGDIYRDGQIFSTALRGISDLIGSDSTDLLLLQSLPYLNPGLSMPDFARLMLRSDSMLHQARFSSALQTAFARHKLLGWPSAVHQLIPKDVRIRNTASFTEGIGPLLISLPVSGCKLELTDITGHILLNETIAVKSHVISSEQLKSGIYLIRIYQPDGNLLFYEKVIRN